MPYVPGAAGDLLPDPRLQLSVSLGHVMHSGGLFNYTIYIPLGVCYFV